MLLKNMFRQIKRSPGRFLSLVLILLVGVGFFAGIRASVPDIVRTITLYARAHELMDYQVVSTMGLTDADVAALKSLKHADAVVPSYSLDVLAGEKAVRLLAIESSVNTVRLVAGRMPAADGECLADSRHYRIGDKITISGDADGKLTTTGLTVVGLARSPLFMSSNYGSTTVGDGKLYSFLFVRRELFTLPAYTQIYLRAKGVRDADVFSDAAETMAGQLKKELVTLQPERETARYQEIYDQAADAIRAHETELDAQQSQGEARLADAKAALDAGQKKLDAARRSLRAKAAALETSAEEQEASFQSAREEIAAGRGAIRESLQSAGLTEEQLDEKVAGLQSAIRALRDQQSGMEAGSAAYAQLGAQIAQYADSCGGLVRMQTGLQTLDTQQAQLDQGVAAFQAQAAAARRQIADGQSELAANQKDLDTGYAAYARNLADFQSQMAAAQAQIRQAEDQLADIAKPRWTILDRNDVINGYGDLKSAMKTITSIAAVLPLFFILLVILMTSNTMARMIAEQRGELGTLASLGFADGRLLAAYLFYVLSATALGASGGYFLGCAVIPRIIYSCFPYVLPALAVRDSPAAFAGMLAASLGLMAAVTVYFCRRELREAPAALMRPVPPPSGNTILLEKVNFIWRRLSFTWKVTFRNLFRYKQRALMTVVGAAGCTALLLAGFGIRDCIHGVAERQYGTLFRYDDILVLKDETQTISADLGRLLDGQALRNPLLMRQPSVTCEASGKSVDAYLVVPENASGFRRYFVLRDPRTAAAETLGENGVVISRRLADIYRIRAGGTIRVTDSDGHGYELPVSAVTENYIQNYIYMSPALYGRILGRPPAYNMIVSGFAGDQKTLANRLIADGRFVSVSFTDDILAQADKESASLGGVVMLLIGVASLLAVIVLYNLTSINISERTREIATLKVLGFNDRETNAYVYREAMLLTLIGIGVGLAAGVGLHHMVMGYIERDEYEYFRTIHGLSYLWSCLIMGAIALAMQLVTFGSLKKIGMTESLQSAE